MWLLVALAAWGHVCLHSISHQVYTWYISGIYLVYANKNVIYQVYTWYILMGKSIYQVYTWYIPGILHDQTVTWLVPKCRRKFWVGVCQVYTVCRHMKGICMFYTRYIPDIYYWSIFISGVCLVYSIYMFTWNLSLQWCYILGICLVYTIDICGIY